MEYIVKEVETIERTYKVSVATPFGSEGDKATQMVDGIVREEARKPAPTLIPPGTIPTNEISSKRIVEVYRGKQRIVPRGIPTRSKKS